MIATQTHPAAVTTPNFLYIGTSKAGSTWIYGILSQHPQAFMATGKGLYFFDGHYDRGIPWYQSCFAEAAGQPVVGEISHSYLFSVDACTRISQLDPEMKLMVCFREPAERAFSAYLDGVKNGQIDCTFEEALEKAPSLIDRGRYATHLRPYLETFGSERIHVGVFDELASDPERFASRIFEFLGIQPVSLPTSQSKKMMPAARPRSYALAQWAKKASVAAKTVGLRKLRSRVKRSRLIRNMLYRSYSAKDKPVMSQSTRSDLRERFAGEVYALDRMLGSSFARTWGY